MPRGCHRTRTVLVLSRSDNLHADAVEEELRHRGSSYVRINVDCLDGGDWSFALSPTDGTVVAGDDRFRIDDICGVFCHHPQVGLSPELGIDALDRELCVASWRNAIDWLEQVLDDARWINRPSACRQTASLALQLETARQVGFSIPDTVFTTEIGAVRAFAAKHSSIVLKSGNLNVSLVDQRLLTQVVDPGTIDAETLAAAPCLFQQNIEKKHELRVHIIGDSVLACRIDSQACEATRMDWRNYSLAKTPHYGTDLEPALAARCVDTVHRLGLEMGILDMIVTPEGDTVFLECNAQGHWIWIEQLTGLPITSVLADCLLAL